MKLSIGEWAAAVSAAFYANSAYAYLDPGTGSILLQGLIATVAAGLVTGRLWWHKVKSIFVKTPEPEKDEEESAADNP